MTKTLSVKDVSIQTLITLTRNGDEIVLEENGEPLAKVTPLGKNETNQKVSGSSVNENRIDKSFDEETSLWENASDADFLNFEKEISGEN